MIVMTFDILLPVITYPDQTQVAGLGRALDLASTLAAMVVIECANSYWATQGVLDHLLLPVLMSH